VVSAPLILLETEGWILTLWVMSKVLESHTWFGNGDEFPRIANPCRRYSLRIAPMYRAGDGPLVQE
jgi:hypothetical protein